MKTKLKFLKWLMILLLLGGATGAWAQTISSPYNVCVGTTSNYWIDYPTTPNLGSTYAWTVDGGEAIQTGQGSDHITIIWDAAGTYNITVQATVTATGCQGPVRTQVVIVDPLPSIAAAGIDQDLCGTLVATLAGNAPAVGTGTWTVVSGPGTITFANANVATTTATATAYGSYVLRWTIANGTCPPTSDDVTINYQETATIAAAGADQDLCGTLVATLAGNAPTVGNGTWTVVSGPGTITFANANLATTTATATAYGSYVLRWTIANGTCTPTSDDVTINYQETATIAAAGADQDLCGTLVATLAGNAPTVGTGTWTVVSGPGTITFANANLATTTATATAYGSYVLRWTIANGTCTPTSDDVTINYQETATIAAAGADQDLCGTLVATLAGNAPTVGTGTWTVVSGPGTITFANANLATTTATATAYGSYVLRWTIANGTCTPTSDDVTINYQETATIAAAGADQDLCGTLVATLAGNAPTVGTGTWTVVSGPGTITFANANVATTTATATAYGSYVLRWTIANGTCTPTSDDVTINYQETATIAAAGADQDLCGTLVATLAGNAPTVGNGTWTVVSGPGTITFANANLATTTATATAYGSYVLRWTIANGTCTPTSDDVTINYQETATIAAAGADQDLCGTLVATLAGNAPTVGTGTWTVVSGPGTITFANANLANTSATATAYGTYVLRWTIANGTCTPTFDDVTINYQETATIAAAGPDQTLCGALVTTLAGNTATVGTGTWTLVSGPGTITFGDINDPTTTATASVAGVYTLRWTIANGTCLATFDEVVITFGTTPATTQIYHD